jgi:hypothetical protein
MGINTRSIAANAILHITTKGAKYTGGNSMQGNGNSWATCKAYLAKNKQATRAQLTAHLQSSHNHGNFVRYQLGTGCLGFTAPKS